MFKIQPLTKITLFLSVFFSCISISWWHPLDISNSSFTFSDKTIVGITYFHPSQVEATIAATWVPLRSLTYDDYITHKEALFEYIQKQTEFQDEAWNICPLDSFEAELTWVDDLFIKGFPVEYRVNCKASVRSFTYKLWIYTHLPLQTNRVSIYDWKTGERVSYKVLTSKIDTAVFSSTESAKKLLDTDRDQLPDEEEAVYRTDPNKADTDGDFYSDYEEVMYWWNPLDARLSPGQLGRKEPRDWDVTLPGGIIQNNSSEEKIAGKAETSISQSFVTQDTLYTSGKDQTLLDTLTFGYYRSVLKELESIRKNGMNIHQLFIVGGVLFLLGFLHALGPGHSKWFMAAYIIGSQASLFSSIQYALLFTGIHLLDVTIMVFTLKFANAYIDVQSYLGLIMKMGVLLLVVLSLGLFLRSVKTLIQQKRMGKIDDSLLFNVENSNTPQTVTKRKWKSGIYMAAITWLAPCSFAWSILLILFAIGRLDLVAPLLAFFGFWILLALSLVAVTVYFIREKAYSFSGKKYENIFPLISSIFLLIFSAIFASALFL